MVVGERRDDVARHRARPRERELAVGLPHRRPHDQRRQRERRGEHGPDERGGLDDPEPAGMLESGGRHGDDAGQRQVAAFGRA